MPDMKSSVGMRRLALQLIRVQIYESIIFLQVTEADSSNGNDSQPTNGRAASREQESVRSENDLPQRGTNGAGVNGSNGYQGVDAQNDLEGCGWRENLSVDEEAVRRSKDLVETSKGASERSMDKEASQSVK